MADTLMKLSIETDLISDAARSLTRARKAVAKRHGARFRELERRIDALPESAFEPKIHQFDDGTFIFAVPTEWSAILADARKLGLI